MTASTRAACSAHVPRACRARGGHGARRLDAYEELLRDRQTFFPPITGRSDSPDYQLWHGEAIGTIATAEAAVMNVVQQWHDTAGREGAFTGDADLRLAVICGQVVSMCWRAVEHRLFRTVGTGSLRNGGRIERIWRDLSMVHTHAGPVFLSSAASRELSKARMGVDAAPIV
ncbi:hypothetical protein [Actinomadura sp. CNU-125]|uniref:hypothetical protein n=1 Tax=Actinomadura sp. CNU-125 TaxID=1904961 RepID=UPI0021CCF1D2|nr:hypothetical protein [Actinomadura sp. CNU-125]